MKASRVFIVSIITCIVEVLTSPVTRTVDNSIRVLKNTPQEYQQDIPNLIEITRKLTKIYESGAPMKLTADIFAGANQLEFIDLSNGEVIEIESRAFYGPKKMKKLNLSGNLLTTLPRDLFPQGNSIKEINLSNNQIEVLNRATFNNLQELKKLDLSHNKLTVLDGSTFVDMIHLQELDLTGNPIRSISESFFASLPQGLQLSFDDDNLDVKSRLLADYWAV